jgi:hypothetical protein
MYLHRYLLACWSFRFPVKITQYYGYQQKYARRRTQDVATDNPALHKAPIGEVTSIYA